MHIEHIHVNTGISVVSQCWLIILANCFIGWAWIYCHSHSEVQVALCQLPLKLVHINPTYPLTLMVQSRFSSTYHCCNVFEYLRFHLHFVLQSCCLLYVSETNKREILWRSDVSKTLRPPCGASKMIVFIIKREILIFQIPKDQIDIRLFCPTNKKQILTFEEAWMLHTSCLKND